MKLYTYDDAPNPARLKMFLDFKGIEIDTQQIDMTRVEQQGEAYLAINPEATLPALVLDDGTLLTSVMAMTQYLDALYPERPLTGTTPEEKARVVNANQQVLSGIFMAIAETFRNSHPAFANRGLPGTLPLPQIPELAERGKKRLETEMTRWNETLATQPFVAGDFFSVADMDLLAALDFASWGARTAVPDALTHLLDWRQRARETLQAR